MYYAKHVAILCKTNVDIYKLKIIKLAYIGKATSNINGTTIHFALAIK
jgi:hypothetical protein